VQAALAQSHSKGSSLHHEEQMQIRVEDHDNGSYSLSFRSELSGTYPVKVTIGQVHVSCRTTDRRHVLSAYSCARTHRARAPSAPLQLAYASDAARMVVASVARTADKRFADDVDHVGRLS